MKNRPSATDEEIRSYMNFDSVVKQYKVEKKAKQNRIRNTSLVLCILGISFLVYFNWPVTTTPVVLNVAPPLETLMITDSTQSNSETITVIADEIAQTSGVNRDEPLPSNKVETIQEKTQTIKNNESGVPAFQYTEAEPSEGYPNLYEYFARELRYPAEAIKDSIQGIVSVSFLVDKEGKPVQIKIMNSLGTAFDKEVQRLIENMPAWKPATLNGKAVEAKISLPFTFQIGKTNPEKK